MANNSRLLGGPIVNGLIDAYKAKLAAGNVESKIAADLAASEIAVETAERTAMMQYRIAELGHWSEPDKLMGYSSRSISRNASSGTRFSALARLIRLAGSRHDGKPDRRVLLRKVRL